MSGLRTPAPTGPELVRAFLDDLDHPLKDGVLVLHEEILAADPGIGEVIKWNAPSFRYAGQDRITFRLAPGRPIQLLLHRGAKVHADADAFVFDDPHGLVRWLGPDRGLVEFTDVAAVRAAVASGQVTDLVRRWVRS